MSQSGYERENFMNVKSTGLYTVATSGIAREPNIVLLVQLRLNRYPITKLSMRLCCNLSNCGHQLSFSWPLLLHPPASRSPSLGRREAVGLPIDEVVCAEGAAEGGGG